LRGPKGASAGCNADRGSRAGPGRASGSAREHDPPRHARGRNAHNRRSSPRRNGQGGSWPTGSKSIATPFAEISNGAEPSCTFAAATIA
jgi:hypothetical protein